MVKCEFENFHHPTRNREIRNFLVGVQGEFVAGRFLLIGLFFAALAFYGSLLPIDYQPIDWTDSVRRWREIPWYQLGIERRADWIANALVMIPSAFFLTGAACMFHPAFAFRLLLSSLAGIGLAVLVVGIEFVQIWFPPRTVSQNDVLAGWIGVAIGIGIWWLLGDLLIHYSKSLRASKDLQKQISWLVGAICLGVVVYSLFPFDLVTSREEFEEKIGLGRVGWGFFSFSMASLGTWKGPILSLLKLVPFGVYLGMRPAKVLPWGWILLIPLWIEIAQVPIYSKFACVSDVFAGWAGGLIGWWLATRRERWMPWVDRWWFWRGGWIAATFLFSVAYFLRSRSGNRVAMDLEERVSFFFQYPFTYYYFGSEYESVTRILSKGAVFFVLGMLQGLDIRASGYRIAFWTLFAVVLWGFSAGMVMEATRLLMGWGISDSTDLIIYSVAAWLGAYSVRMLPEKLKVATEDWISKK
jgi:glycopeptide antibiotics resistance protein/VanZ family protein